MGEVYLARDRKLDRLVALKVLRLEPGEDHARLERFAVEARAASALSHPGVAHIYGIGQSGDVCFIAMEYVQGETLRNATLTPAEILDAGIQAAEALDAAHAAGIIHRDIKPANLMRTAKGLLKVLDFGLAKRMGAAGFDAQSGITQPGIVMGTLGYMSPEQVLGHAVDHRTDIFSLGVVLYELLTGKLPFAAGSYEEALAQMTSPQTPPALRSPAGAGIPKAAAAAIMKCIRRDPAQRFQSAGELAQALRAAANPETTSRRQWAAAAGLTLAFGGFAGFRFWETGKSAGQVDSLAVLPFSAAGATPEIDYLREGIAEGVMNRLAGVKGLRVMSRDSAFRHRDMPAVEAGRRMSVRGVVTGAIRELENALVVSAELVDAQSGERIWGGDFRGGVGDALQFRDTIASHIASTLEVKLASTSTGAAPARETHDPVAHDLYLRGKFEVAKRTPEGIEKGIEYFRKSVAIDSDFGLAYAGISEAYLLAADLYAPAAEALPLAREAADSAIASDPELADGYVALGLVQMHGDLAWSLAEANFRKAVQLNPSLAAAHAWLGWLLSATARTPAEREHGLAENRRAVELEPRSPMMRALLAANLYFGGGYQGAVEEANRTLEIDPAFQFALFWKTVGLVGQGRASQAVSQLEPIARQAGPAPLLTSALVRAYSAAGEGAKARAALRDLEASRERLHVSQVLIAGARAAVGDQEGALASLEASLDAHAKLLIWIGQDPVYQDLRRSPRFQALLRKIGL